MPAQQLDQVEIRPQAGPQEIFAASSAEIAIYGGAAGGGKSWALLFEPLYHIDNAKFGATIFRRTFPQIAAQGGLWEESMSLYPKVGGVPHLSDMKWSFPSGAEVKFAHLQHEATVLNYQGSQIAMIGWDELTHFTEYQFVYMLSRNRSTSGVSPYIRATTNPDAASWVSRWVEWYIDPSTGVPIPERSGVVRWFCRDGETIRWGDSREQLAREYPGKLSKSFTFVPATLSDNKKLTTADPGYRANLDALGRVERERLLRGNWLVSSAIGRWPPEYFGQHLYFQNWPHADDRELCVIAWDPSTGESAGDKFGDYSAFTVSVRDTKGIIHVDADGSQSWPVEEAIDVGLELYQKWKPDAFVIEVNGFQKLIKRQFVRRAQEMGILLAGINTIDNRTPNKKVRIQRLGEYLEARTLRLKGDSSGARRLAEQLMVFPAVGDGIHDDFPDSLEMNIRTLIHLNNLRNPPPPPRPRGPFRRS